MIDNLQQQLATQDKTVLPPVEKWNPPLSGTMDLIIRKDGSWWHEGAEIKRFSLVKLFSGILKKEGEDYFLVTPAEKWKIQVEDVPFLIVKADFFSGESSFIQFVTNVGDVFTLDREHPLHMVENGFKEVIPYVLVRNNLEARVSRPVYYDLVSKAEERVDQAAKYVYISSAGESFDLGEIPE